MFAEEFVRIEQQVIKVHGTGLEAAQGVVLIDIAYFRPFMLAASSPIARHWTGIPAS